MEIETILTHF